MLKKTLSKILLVLLIMLLLNNFIFNNFVFAADNPLEDILGDLLKSVVGLLSLPVRIIALAIGKGMKTLTALVAFSENHSGKIETTISPFDILFNRVALVDINFFDMNTKSDLVNTIRKSVAAWYLTMRLIASVVLLAVLVYVGIRMAISTIASEKATYKKMLYDWVVSLALIFLLHYIIIFVIHINSVLVEAMASIAEDVDISEAIDGIFKIALWSFDSIVDINSIPATIIYCMLCWQILGLLISYINRMLKLAFLIIIAPLITLTYSMDKMGDGKAQALDSWLKEFVFTVLIQPFHCIIYLSMVSMAFDLLHDAWAAGGNDSNFLATAIIAVLCVKFVREAEDIVRKIFNFGDDNKSTSLQAGAVAAGAAVAYSGKIGKAAGGIAGKTARVIGGAPEALANTATKIGANIHALSTISNSEGKSFSERKEDYYIQKDEEKASKYESQIENNESKEKLKVSDEKVSQEVADRTKAIMDKNPGMSTKRARAQARKELANEFRKGEKAEKRPKAIKKARGTINGIRNATRNSEVMKSIGSYAKFAGAAGMGVFVGAGSYGTGSGAFESVAKGAAAYNATQAGVNEFFKSSGRTLSNSARSSLKALGVSDRSQATSMMARIMARGDRYEDEDEIKKMLDDLKEKLKELGFDENEAYNIQNKIQKGIKEGKPLNPETLLKQHLKTNDIDPKLLNSTRKLSNFENEKNIYEIGQQASDLGISDTSFMNQTLNSMTEDDYIDSAKNIPEGGNVSDMAEQAKTGSLNISGLDLRQKEELQKELEDEVERLKKDFEEDAAYGLEVEGLEDAIMNMDRIKAELEMEIQEEYERNVEDILAQVEALNSLSARDADALVRQVLDKEMFMKRMEEVLSDKQGKLIEMDMRMARQQMNPGPGARGNQKRGNKNGGRNSQTNDTIRKMAAQKVEAHKQKMDAMQRAFENM